MSLNDGAVGMAVGLIAAGVLTLSAWLMREGLRAETAFDARKVARRPAFPRKMVSSVLAGIGIAIAAYKFGTGPDRPAFVWYGNNSTARIGLWH